MNLTDLRKKSLILIAGIIIIVAGLVIAVVLSLKRVSRQVAGPSPSPSPALNIAPNIIYKPEIKPQDLPSETKEIREKIIASQIGDRNGDILLYKSDSFIIEYIPSPDLFMVTIKKDPAEEAKKQAQNWFLSFGLKQSDLCNLPVSFILRGLELRRANPKFTSLPEGCRGTRVPRPQ